MEVDEALRQVAGSVHVELVGPQQERRRQLGNGWPLAVQHLDLRGRGDRLPSQVVCQDLPVAPGGFQRVVVAEVDHAALAVGAAQEDDVLVAGLVVNRGGDTPLLGLHGAGLLDFYSSSRLCYRVRQGWRSAQVAWESKLETGGPCRNRTCDFDLVTIALYQLS